jgi:hypothetical protein
MATIGIATVDFGAFPGTSEAKLTVTGQTGITTASYVEAWVGGDNTTADHTVHEHYMEEFICFVDTLVDNTGFNLVVRPNKGRSYGQYKINYVWSN